jgi:putative endonuclease
MISTAQRQRSQRHGIWAEYAALFYLTLKGYRFVTSRYKTKLGEIDLIVRRGKTLVFVEVKARANRDDAAYAVHAKNQSRVVQASQMFLMAHPAYQEYQVRFDVVLVAWYSMPHHLVHAFGAPL